MSRSCRPRAEGSRVLAKRRRCAEARCQRNLLPSRLIELARVLTILQATCDREIRQLVRGSQVGHTRKLHPVTVMMQERSSVLLLKDERCDCTEGFLVRETAPQNFEVIYPQFDRLAFRTHVATLPLSQKSLMR